MGDVSFSVSPEANAQIPEKPIHFRFENTALDTTHAMGFVYDSSNNTTTLYELNENTLQFEEDVEMKTESIVVGCFAVPATGVNLSRVNLTLSIKFPTVAILDAVLPATKKKRVEY